MTTRKLIGEWRSRFQARPSLKNSLKKLSGIKKRSWCRICIHPLRFSLWRTQISKNVGYIKMIFGNGSANRDSKKPGAISKITLQEHLRKHKYRPGLKRPRGIHPMCNPHNPKRRCSQDHTMALENIATATQSDRISVVLLTKTIIEISTQVNNVFSPTA